MKASASGTAPGSSTTYFYETTNSSKLRFNDNNLIVITEVTSPASDAQNSYLVPRPGVRLNLADLVDNLPVGLKLWFVAGINNHGDMIGDGLQPSEFPAFLLERIGDK